MDQKTTDYCLLDDTSSVEDFLKSEFKASSNKIKKHFKKAFLSRSLKGRSVLSLPLNFINDGEINPMYEGEALTVIAEDENFFVFNKNPNQFVHPLTYDESDNCLSYLRQTRPELLLVNRKNYDRGLLYRLDYETSGVMIYMKGDELYQKLRENFSVIAKEKKYWCWVEGEMKLSGSFTHYFSSSEEKGKRVKVSDHVGQKGELALLPLKYDQNMDRTLVEVKLTTGLRHQIRAQMAHLGFPLVGDEFYGGPKAQRLYLHAHTYSLEHAGKEYSWASVPLNFSGL
jgi:23S rRNA pseudouridine1911/1915/1917 synthase